MKQPLHIFVALPDQNNDYQVAQVRAAEEAAKSQNATIEVSFCNGDAVEQSQQILKCVLSHSKESGVAGIIVVAPLLRNHCLRLDHLNRAKPARRPERCACLIKYRHG